MIISNKRVLEICDAVTRAAIERDTLLSSLPRQVRDNLKIASSPGQQIVWDFNALLELDQLSDGGRPVQNWLETAVHFAHAKEHQDILKSALDELSGKVRADIAAFARAYRDAVRPTADAWESVARFSVGSSKSTPAPPFTEAYYPLRIRERGPSKEVHDATSAIGLLGPSARLLVTGPGGSGKSTWLRWLFREVVSGDDYLPILLTLRRLVTSWQAESPAEPALDAAITSWCGRYVGDGAHRWRDVASADSPRLLLFLDGWDELGSHGKEAKDQLQRLLHRLPSMGVVITSREQAEELPTAAQGFTELELLPLDSAEIEAFLEKLSKRVGLPGPSSPSSDSKEPFRAPRKPRRSATTPLFLTMTAPLYGSHPLPTKLHRLWQLCVDTLITDPDRKAADGMASAFAQFRPEDAEARKYAVAHLACFLLKNLDTERPIRNALGGTWDELRDLLPPEFPSEGAPGWTRDLARDGFLVWLADAAGLLERTQDGAGFVHVGFRDYLAAWYLNEVITSAEDRATFFVENAARQRWWDALALWMSMVDTQDFDGVQRILQALLDRGKTAGYWLCGALLAQGAGGDEIWQRWREGRVKSHHDVTNAEVRACAVAWASGTDDVRRKELSDALAQSVQSPGFCSRIRIERWMLMASLDLPPLPEGGFAQAALTTMRGVLPRNGATAAVARVLAEHDPEFPGLEVAAEAVCLAAAWPSPRVQAANLLQLAIAEGATRRELVQLSSRFLRRPHVEESRWRELLQPFRKQVAAAAALGAGADEWGRTFGGLAALRLSVWQDTMAPLVLIWAEDRSSNGAFRTQWQRANALMTMAQHILKRIHANKTRNADFGWTASALGTLWDEGWTDLLGLDSTPAWLPDFVGASVNSFVKPRVTLTFLQDMPGPGRFVVEALRLYARGAPVGEVGTFLSKLDSPLSEDDSFWNALAKHVLSRSTAEDCDLLVRRVERAGDDTDLGRAVRYAIRGDLVLNDGSELCLDDLAREVGLAPLPILGAMPPVVELDDVDFKQARATIAAGKAGEDAAKGGAPGFAKTLIVPVLGNRYPLLGWILK